MQIVSQIRGSRELQGILFLGREDEGLVQLQSLQDHKKKTTRQ